MDIEQKLWRADMMISFSKDGIEIVKNRNGTIGKIDLADLLELAKPYCEDYYHDLMSSWIDKLKNYRIFK